MMAIFVILSLFFVLLATGLRDPRLVLYTAVFLAPWQGLDVEVGLRVTGYRVAIAALVTVVLLRSIARNNMFFNSIKPNPWFWAFIFYAVSYSTAQIFWLPATEVGSGVLRSGQMRSVSQIIMFYLTIAPILLIPYVIRQQEDILLCGKFYLWSITILAALGFVQLVIWYLSGTNPFPFKFVNSLLSGTSSEMLGSGIDRVRGVAVYRMNSFGGEPKGLATGLAVGLLILQVGYSIKYSPGFRVWKAIALWVFLMFALILTWSTSGFFLWIIGTLTIAFVGLGSITRKYGKKNVIMGIFLLLVVVGGMYNYATSDENFNSIYSEVATNRFIERNPIEDFDETVLNFLKDQPEHLLLGVGLGNVPQYAESYIPMYAYYRMRGNVFAAKSGYLRIISDLGLFGLLMFAFAVWWWLLQIKHKMKNLPKDSTQQYLGHTLFTLGIVLFISGMARTYVWPQMFLTLGLCAAYLSFSYHKQKVT